MTPLQRLALAAITRYRRKGGGVGQFRVECNFEPGCSEYAATAIRRFGFWRGLRLSVGRIRRCNDRDQVGLHRDEVPLAAVSSQTGQDSEADQRRCRHV